MIDTLEAIIAYLATDSALVTQVGTKIYGSPGLPPEYRGEKALLVAETAGDVAPTTPRVAPGVWLHGYGPTPAAARAVARAAGDALHRKGPVDVTVTGGKARLLCSHMVGSPEDVKEPETGWQRATVRCELQWCDTLIIP